MSTLKTPKNIENNPKFSEDKPEDLEFSAPDLRDVITEDDTPVDNLISEKQQRLLTTTLYNSFVTDFPFLLVRQTSCFFAQFSSTHTESRMLLLLLREYGRRDLWFCISSSFILSIR